MRSETRKGGGSPDGSDRHDLVALALADELNGDGIRGEVRFDRGSRALYATDYSIYRQVPIGVVILDDGGEANGNCP